ncbi:Thymidine kinase [Lactobacillus plantarum ZJ316] [Lactiplantibacillus mudanjiangensis]|nr:Thymidine kinase [Lactobacillus plantarum ZJ316] [Lactiplantibacillus mudanjiangensis]
MAQLFFRYGAMNSGKTIEILKVAHNYEEQNKSVIIMTSGVDTRAGIGHVKSRIGLSRDATPIFDDTNVLETVKALNTDAACVLIDEAQFLQKHHVLELALSLIHISEPTRRRGISYAVFCLKKKKIKQKKKKQNSQCNNVTNI